VEGAVLAARTLGVKVILVGRKELVQQELKKHDEYGDLPIEVEHASDVITMEDATQVVRTKKDSSLRIASRLVRDGRARGLVSAGNTGAVMATAKIVQGVVPGVTRPALAAVFPTVKGTPSIMVDVGANVDCSPRMLAQFAVMGEIYSRIILRRPKPRVGLLSIGEEAHKGNDLTRAARELIKELNIDFLGNVEGRDLFGGDVDVIVCDGFIGNVALKVSEGLGDMVKVLLREALESTITGKIGYAISKTAFGEFKKRLDYSEYGGAPLLGVRGVCIISHGRANANAMKNAIRVAAEFSQGKVNQVIEEELTVGAR
jgi:phosphate acyltransferase